MWLSLENQIASPFSHILFSNVEHTVLWRSGQAKQRLLPVFSHLVKGWLFTVKPDQNLLHPLRPSATLYSAVSFLIYTVIVEIVPFILQIVVPNIPLFIFIILN